MSLTLTSKVFADSESDSEPASSTRPELEERRHQTQLWARQLEHSSASELIAWALERWRGELAISTSFQAEGMVILDLAHRLSAELGTELSVLTLDTGRLPPETYDFIERVRARYGVDVEMVLPDAAQVAAMVRGAGPNLFYQSVEARQLCCQVRKVEPLRRALAPYAAWITGLRRDQTANRGATAKVELDLLNGPDGDLVKISPLADWSAEAVWRYVREENVPYHPLYDRGYQSIGCAPCTRPTRPQEDARSGRWWWEQGKARECGLHVLQGGGR